MAVSINCNYSRCAIPALCQRIIGNSRRRLSQSELTGVIDEYNKKFESEAKRLDSSIGYKRIPCLLLTFTRKWHPQSQKDTFLRPYQHGHTYQQMRSVNTASQTAKNVIGNTSLSHGPSQTEVAEQNSSQIRSLLSFIASTISLLQQSVAGKC